LLTRRTSVIVISYKLHKKASIGHSVLDRSKFMLVKFMYCYTGSGSVSKNY